MSDKIPERRYKWTIEIEADTPDDLRKALSQIAYQVSINGDDYESHNGFSAGYHSSWGWQVTVNDSVTGDLYRKALKEYAEQLIGKRTDLKDSPDYSNDK